LDVDLGAQASGLSVRARGRHVVIHALVVGGGPAGSSVALRLARAGMEVTVLERSRFPRSKVCGEYLSPAALAALGDLGMLHRVVDAAHSLRTVTIAGFDAAPVDLQLPGDGALSMPRSALDMILLDAARDAGACTIAGVFLDARERADGVSVIYRDAGGDEKTVDAHVLVGADGAWSSVAQRMGMTRDVRGQERRRGRWAVGGHLIGDGGGTALEMYVGAAGYYARNPLGGDRINAMLVLPEATTGDDAERAVEEISRGRRRFEAGSLEKRVAVGPLRYAPQRIAKGRVLLAGDAAGLLDPFIGQGVAIALETSIPVLRAVRRIVDRVPLARAGADYTAAHRAAVVPRTVLASAVNVVIRTSFLRRRAERAIRKSAASAETLLAAVAGAAPPLSAFSPRVLAGLLA
jgi:menaquinone-9 beta-reductase